MKKSKDLKENELKISKTQIGRTQSIDDYTTIKLA